MIRPLAGAVALTLLLSGCANDAWKDVEPDPSALALISQYRAGSLAGDPGQHRLGVLLSAARDEVGEPYEWGAEGPAVWDCSSFVQHAYSEVGIRLPRTARAQRDWMADGNGVPVASGEERPGDLVFWDDYLGPEVFGHVAMVWDPAESSTIEARTPETGYYRYQTVDEHAMFEIWRAAELAEPVAGAEASTTRQRLLARHGVDPSRPPGDVRRLTAVRARDLPYGQAWHADTPVAPEA